VIVSSKLATLHELDTVYGSKDVQDMLEILSVDAHNARVAQEMRGKHGDGY
jgi:hypothetical protein